MGPFAHQVTKLGTSLAKEGEQELIDQLIKNVDLFAWAPSDMPGIDTKVVNHRLAIHLFTKLVAQMKWKFNEEKKYAINKKVGKLFVVGLIT